MPEVVQRRLAANRYVGSAACRTAAYISLKHVLKMLYELRSYYWTRAMELDLATL